MRLHTKIVINFYEKMFCVHTLDIMLRLMLASIIHDSCKCLVTVVVVVLFSSCFG